VVDIIELHETLNGQENIHNSFWLLRSTASAINLSRRLTLAYRLEPDSRKLSPAIKTRRFEAGIPLGFLFLLSARPRNVYRRFSIMVHGRNISSRRARSDWEEHKAADRKLSSTELDEKTFSCR
jgi:hypothetical protein